MNAPHIPNAARESAEREAAKRERHKAKSLVHKQWKAVFTIEKGWHVALVDDQFHAEFAERMRARNALLRGDLVAFQQHAGDALLARCARAVEAASGTEAQRATTVKQGSVHEGPTGEAGDAQRHD